jgi:2-polyprenyl-3-methyl-5-hydroxy-6-metoxy-1,4-benzoquinol methylase
MPDIARALYAEEIVRHVLALRECLVRHDENLKAWQLLEAAPYFCAGHPELEQARKDQFAMVRHILEPDTYGNYYAENAHERPFEEQYGITPEVAHEHLYRVAFLREGLRRQENLEAGLRLQVCDLSANDGWMAVNLAGSELVHAPRVDCVDLHPGNCDLARERAEGCDVICDVHCGDLHDYRGRMDGFLYDAVVLFETLEHVPDPRATLRHMVELCRPGGRLYVSTPQEAIEQGNVPNWAHVEPKGHVRVFTVDTLGQLLSEYGKIERFQRGPDRTMVAEVTPHPAG